MDECKALQHGLFAAIDGICDKHQVEKIETIGDAYLAGAYARSPFSSIQAFLWDKGWIGGD